MSETNQTYPNLVAKIQVYMSNKTQNSNYFSLLRKSGSYKNMLNFMAIMYIDIHRTRTNTKISLFHVVFCFKKNGLISFRSVFET